MAPLGPGAVARWPQASLRRGGDSVSSCHQPGLAVCPFQKPYLHSREALAQGGGPVSAFGHLPVRNMGATRSRVTITVTRCPGAVRLSPVGPVVLLRGLFPRPGTAISKGHRPGRAQGPFALEPPWGPPSSPTPPPPIDAVCQPRSTRLPDTRTSGPPGRLGSPPTPGLAEGPRLRA